MKRLLVVEDTFAVTGRGLIVAPMPARHELRAAGDFDVELRLPDGTRRPARLSILMELFSPTPAVQRWTCMFPDLAKADVPVGTEIWCPPSVFMPRLLNAR